MAGLDAFGTSLSRHNGTTYDAVASITNVDGPGFSRDTIDVTAHDSVDHWREFIGSLIDGGEVSADLNWNPTSAVGSEGDVTTVLMTDAQNPLPINYEIAFPDGSKFTAPLLVTDFSPRAPHDGKLTARLSFKVAGKPTFTPAA